MSAPPKNLADMLFGQTRGRILALLFDVPDRAFYGREIARLTNSSSGTVRRDLGTLAHFGLVLKSTVGHQVFYRANSSHSIFNEMQSLLAKTAGIYHSLRRALEPLAEQIDFAIVYGSTVRGDSLADSDIDVMVIGDATLDDVLQRLRPVENILGRAVNPTTFSLQEFQAKLQRGNHFLSAVLRGKKIVLIGDEDEFAKMGGVRLASR
jgi:predicted nucleotidyltransferase